MQHRLRDAALSTAVLLVLFGLLIAMNPLVRERFSQFVGGSSEQWSAPGRAASTAMANTRVTAGRYATDNSYQVCFVIVAGFLLIFMLRM